MQRVKLYYRVQLLAIGLSLMTILAASAQGIPALNEIPAEVAAVRADLVSERAGLDAERSALRARVLAQKTQCSSVEQNTAAWQDCLQLRSALQAEMRAHIDRTNAFNASIPSLPVAIPIQPENSSERHYTFAGNGLIAGTTWTLYASREPGKPEERMCATIRQQSKLAGSPYDAGVDCKRYQFVLGMAVSVDAFTDLSNRVVFDDLTNGRFSADLQGLYDKLRGKEFAELGCHSNGAMICLAALENRDIKAGRVVLYGPQVTRESLAMWNQLVQEHRVDSVKVYLNENDIVPGVSIAYADYKRNEKAAMDAVKADPSIHSIASAGAVISAGMATEMPLFNIDSLKRTINETSPRLEVQSFSCDRDRASMDCHGMEMYRAKVSCTGKSSGRAVPGTALPGGAALVEPPMPCEAIGARP